METEFVYFFYVFFFKFLNIVCCDRIKTHTYLTRKNCNVSMRPQKKVLHECSSTLEFFFVKYLHFLFWSANIIFSCG